MTKLFAGIALFLILLSFELNSPLPSQTKLTVELDNIRNGNGKMYIFLYNYENQYPYNPYLHFEINKQSLFVKGKINFTIPEGLDLGKYALSVLDDENENHDLDTFFGLPTEGYGFSNNVSPLLSLPDYEDLVFDLKNSTTIHLRLQYIL